MRAMKSVNGLMPKVGVVRQETALYVTPKYLFAQIPRIHYKIIDPGRKSKDGWPILQVKMVKIRTLVALPTGDIRIQSKDGGRITFELLVAIEHRGKE
jgi:hypothetical protein